MSKAHLADEGGVHALLMGVETPDAGPQSLLIFIANNTAVSITLRGIATRRGDLAKIERTKTVLWTDVRQPVKFLRLSPGAQIEMVPPDYIVTLPGVSQHDLMSGLITLVADFGPDGQVDVGVPGPVGAPQDTDLFEPFTPQTME